MVVFISGFYLSCTSTPVVTHTPEEIVQAQQAVVKVMEITTLAGAESFGSNWNVPMVNIVPPEADKMLTKIESIPGLRMHLESYLQAIKSDTALIAAQIPTFLSREVFPFLLISDPFALINGNSDAVTRFFASQVSPTLEEWIAQQLYKEELKGLKAWNELIRTYNMYTKSRNLLIKNGEQPKAELITFDPVHVITVTIIRHLLDVMKTQEALLRSMAPAYDDPLLALFSVR